MGQCYRYGDSETDTVAESAHELIYNARIAGIPDWKIARAILGEVYGLSESLEPATQQGNGDGQARV